MAAMLVVCSISAPAMKAQDRVLILTENRPSPVQLNSVALFSRRLKELFRANATVAGAPELAAGSSESNLLVVTAVSQGNENRCDTAGRTAIVSAKADSYTISVAGRVALVCAHDDRGLLYGLGRLLRVFSMRNGHIDAPPLHERHTPRIADRGVYFATHFQNFYEGAPLEDVERYVEEMALWGFNQVHFWFDMNWFPEGFRREPNSPGMLMIDRLRHIAGTARAYGMEIGAVGVANEGFRDQPPLSLRADASARRGAFYPDSTICPSRAGGLEMILSDRRRVLELLGPIDVFTYWPYDSGSCGCSLCRKRGNWGSTFLAIGPQISRVVKSANPHARFLVSTWLMDAKERQLVYDQLTAGAQWLDGTVSETKHEAERNAFSTGASRYVKLVFPEISMFDSYGDGYGTNGANPAPVRFMEEARHTAARGFGTELYSEGFYDDLNKIVWVTTLWNPQRTASDIVREYAHYYFGADAEQRATNLIESLERTWGAVKLGNASLAETQRVLDLAEEIGRMIPLDSALARTRWRALRDRAEMDSLMKTIGPDRQLAKSSRLIFEDAAYAKPGFRSHAEAFLSNVKRRQVLIERLFGVHWNYLEYFHMEKTTLAFLPDKMLGRMDWGPLIPALESALSEKDDRRMREAVIRAFRRWWWFNGLTAENYFLL